MLTKKDYCDHKICVALSELGCPVPKYATINIRTKEKEWKMWLPLYDAQKWLREEKKIEVNATYDNIVELHWHWYMKSLTNRNQDTSIINYDSYEQALLAGIKEAIEILKEENND